MIVHFIKAKYCSACAPVLARVQANKSLIQELGDKGICLEVVDISTPDGEKKADEIGINPTLPQIVVKIPSGGTLRVSGGYPEIVSALQSLLE